MWNWLWLLKTAYLFIIFPFRKKNQTVVLEKQQVSVLTKVKLEYCSLSYHSRVALLSEFRTPATQLYYYTMKYLFCFCASYRIKWEYDSNPILSHCYRVGPGLCMLIISLIANYLQLDYNNDKTSSESILVWTLSDLLCDQVRLRRAKFVVAIPMQPNSTASSLVHGLLAVINSHVNNRSFLKERSISQTSWRTRILELRLDQFETGSKSFLFCFHM